VEATYEIDFQRATQVGAATSSVGLALQMAVEGAVIDQIRGESERMGLRVQMSRDEKPEEALTNLRVLSSTRELVPSSQLIRKLNEGQGRYVVNHYQNQRSITVYADVDEKILTASQANAQIEQYFDQYQQENPGLKIFPLGENRDTQESFDSLGEALSIASILVLFVMVLTLGSLWQPVVILLTATPIGVAGVLIIFIIHQRPLSFLAAFGIVGLSGVAVNVGIVLVDRINSLAKEMKFFDALIEGSAQRLRAVLLTSITTVLGLMPTAYGWGGGDPFLEPMALALGWGIAFATISGVVLTPILLGISDDVVQVGKRIFSGESIILVLKDFVKAVFKGAPVRLDHDSIEVDESKMDVSA
jgi:multidrug efflux pump subunit AcrB